jgi:hypothetical protein
VAPLWIEELHISPGVEEKIWVKHHVAVDEVFDVCVEDEDHWPRRRREGTMLVFERTAAGRYLMVALAPRGPGIWTVAPARPMTQTERRQYARR